MIRSCTNRFWFVGSLIAAGTVWLETASVGQQHFPGAELFTNGIRRIRIDLGPESVASLKTNPRKFVAATVTEGVTVYSRIGVHLKGSTGSFRPLDDKPSLTLDFGEFSEGQKFHGLRRIHLNNSVEDPSYVNEKLGSELFQATGIPAPRVARALVALNGRPAVLYVLKEGFTEDFLSCHFKRVGGDLFEPDEGRDVNERLKRNSVRASVQGREALKALAEAASENDPLLRWSRLEKFLDVERFIKFMGMEVMLGHRDGYCLARNNFRVYHDLDSDRMIFLPHGMDQLFGTANLPWQPSFAGLVARAVVSTPEGKQRYSECFGALLTNVFKTASLTNRVDELVQELRPVLSRREWKRIADEAALVKERIVQRRLSLISEFNQPELTPMKFTEGVGRLEGWQIAERPSKGMMSQLTDSEGVIALHIECAADSAASWRTTALLPRGRYRFEGRLRTASVRPMPVGKHQGAELRVSGHARRAGSITGDSSWRKLEVKFQVEQPVEKVEFICELRARSGETWFDLSSLHVIHIAD